MYSSEITGLPRRLVGELDIPKPDPNKPMYFETRGEVLMRVRDGLNDYDPPEIKEDPFTGFRWMQPSEEGDRECPTDPRE